MRIRTGKIDEAVARVADGGRVLISHACGEPRAFVAELVRRAREGRYQAGITIVTGALLTGYEFLAVPQLRLETWHVMPPMFPHMGGSRVAVVPLRYSGIVPTFAPGGPRAVDAVVLTASRPDERGVMSVSASPSVAYPVARRRPLVIVESNVRLPRAQGTARLHVDDVDLVVEVDYEPVPYPPPLVGPVERALAGHLAGLIPTGATLQVGVAALAVLDGLDGLRGLRPWGTLVDAHVKLAEKGALDSGAGVRFHAGELYGTRRVFEWAQRDGRVWLDSAETTHLPHRIMQEQKFVAINSAIEVDLTGQVNAESLGDLQVAGVSGLFDLTLGATSSPGGRAIIALPATAADRARSRIVTRLSSGARVTVPRHLADTVVTEHGIADLRAKSTAERARALIAVADPAFREGLERTWFDEVRT